MQVNKINNNNVSFKAIPVVNIGEDFLEYVGTRPTKLECAMYADELAAVVRVFKRAAGNLGQEADTLALNSINNYMLQITPPSVTREDEKLSVYFTEKSSPITQMLDHIMALAKKLGDNKKIDLAQLYARPYQDWIYRFEGEKMIEVPFADRPAISDAPQELTVEGCLDRIRSLNTKA